jgi:peptidoglycan-N-acetylglucosamine deacetylase
MRELPAVPAPFAAQRVKWPGANQVALTFDDGPCARRTRRTVDVLGDTVATFFVVGTQLRRSPAETIHAASRGHSIQNHTMNHPHLRALNASGILGELDAAANEIAGMVGVRPSVYRPPYGSTDERVRSVTSSSGWYEAMWNGGAPKMDSGSSSIVGAVRSQMRKARGINQGLVLLFHDCSGNFLGMIDALPTVISMLRIDGWEFVALA